MVFPGGSVIKNPPADAGDSGDAGFNPWVGEDLLKEKMTTIPVFLPGKSHGWRSLVSWGHKRVSKS